MKNNFSLDEILLEELADLLRAEEQLVDVLPKMVEASESVVLKAALDDLLEATKEHIYRLQDIFNNIGQSPQGVSQKIMKGLINESENVINDLKRGPSRDVAIISMAQRVEQYEIARYETTREHASNLGHTRIVEVLIKTLDEERELHSDLNELAQGMINVQATGPKSFSQQTKQPKEPSSKTKSGGFYIPEGKFKRGKAKKKSKNTDVSRFIGEGNPNVQEAQDKREEANRDLQNPEDRGDAS